MSLSPECAQHQDREAANVKKILMLAAMGSLGLHGLGWAITAVLPRQVIAEATPPIELLLVSDPETDEPLALEEPLERAEPLALADSALATLGLASSSHRSGSDVLKAAAKLAPTSPVLLESTASAVPDAVAAVASQPEQAVILEPNISEPEGPQPKAAIAPKPDSGGPEALKPAPDAEANIAEPGLEQTETPVAIAIEVASQTEAVETEAKPAEGIAPETDNNVVTDPEAIGPETTEPETRRPSLLDRIKDLRSLAMVDRAQQQAIADNLLDGEAAPTASPEARGPLAASSSTSPGNSNSNSHRPERQTIACRSCSKPNFSQRELEGAEGETKFEIITDGRGHVIDVVVTQSSGSTAVDAKTVDHIKRRWRFEPTSGGATVPVIVDMAVEGSNYHRRREAEGRSDRLEVQVPTPPVPLLPAPSPSATTGSQTTSLPTPSQGEDGSPFTKPESMAQPEPAVTTEPTYEPEPATVTEPTYEPEPAAVAKPIYEPEPVYESDSVDLPEPVGEPVIIVDEPDIILEDPFLGTPP